MENINTNLTENQIQELYNTMELLLRERQDERIQELNMEEFKIHIEQLKADYVENDEFETQTFYEYVENDIYYVVCNE